MQCHFGGDSVSSAIQKTKFVIAVKRKVTVSVGLLYQPCMKSPYTIRDVKIRKDTEKKIS